MSSERQPHDVRELESWGWWDLPIPGGWIQKVPANLHPCASDSPAHARPWAEPLQRARLPAPWGQPRRSSVSRAAAGACSVDTKHLAAGIWNRRRALGREAPWERLCLVSARRPCARVCPHTQRKKMQMNAGKSLCFSGRQGGLTLFSPEVWLWQERDRLRSLICSLGTVQIG